MLITKGSIKSTTKTKTFVMKLDFNKKDSKISHNIQNNKDTIINDLTNVLNILQKPTTNFYYICRLFRTTSTNQVTKEYFKRNKPTKYLHSKFFNHPSFKNGLGWWYMDEKEQRIKFLEHLINKLQNK